MSATSLQCFTIVFPDPRMSQAAVQYQRVNASISFDFLESFNIVTLSTNSAVPGNPISGLLYVPDLPPSDPCFTASEPFVPHNVTRQQDLPDGDYDHVAIAPWLSANCTLKYLAAARLEPTRGFVFFLPTNSSHQPPAATSTIWNLADDDEWKSQNSYPVYVVSGVDGQKLMFASSQYSKNLTDVPWGYNLTELFDSRDYARLFATINTGGGDALPSLWVFLLVVLGILLAVIGSTSLAMHWLQRRRRQSLRRRVANGEVDLEALGIKRLTVPQTILDQLPLYTYGSSAPLTKANEGQTVVSERSTAGPSSSTVVQTGYRPSPLQQPTCAICLDDFVPAAAGTHGTIVRELPCHHIFHPECVDAFLRDSSSLCPMCKKTALPTGYCPRVITNAMVRRERMVRRIRPQQEREADEADLAEHGDGMRLGSRIRSTSTRTFSGLVGLAGRRVSSATASAPSQHQQQSQQMRQLAPPALTCSGTSSPTVQQADNESSAVAEEVPRSAVQVQPSSNPRRTEWARQRALAMLGRRSAPADVEAEEERSLPAWRKAFRGLFPVVER